MKFTLNQVTICLITLILDSNISKAWTRYPLYEDSWYDYRVPEVQYPNKSPLSNNLGDPEEFRRHVFEICRYTFSGAWNLITADKMRFFELRRSLRDRWYYCGLPFHIKPLYREYGEAAVIFYGPGRRNPEQSTTAASIFAYFSQKQAQQRSTLLTPKILSTFPGGRVEEYWQDSRMYKNSEMPLHADTITRKLAYIHGLNPPAPRSPDHFWHEIATLLAFARTANVGNKAKIHLPPQKVILSKIFQINLEAEAIWLRNFMEDLKAPIVFSHGSLREEEIYYRKYGKEDNKITFLDLGWGRYLYRGYDLADYFIEWGIQYDKRLSYPHFLITGDYPNQKSIERLIILYLQSMTTMEREWPAANNTVEGLFEEIRRSTLLSHFFYGVQALFSSFYDYGKMFGYPEYAKARLDMYFQLKKTLIERHKLNIPLFATIDTSGEVIDKGYPGVHVIGLNDKLILDPFFSVATSIAGYVNSESRESLATDKKMEMCKIECYNILRKNEAINSMYELKPTNVLFSSNPSYYSQDQLDRRLNHSTNNFEQENLVHPKLTESDILGALTGKIRNDFLFSHQQNYATPQTVSSSQQSKLYHSLMTKPIEQILRPSQQAQHNQMINITVPQTISSNRQSRLQYQHVINNASPSMTGLSYQTKQYYQMTNNPIRQTLKLSHQTQHLNQTINRFSPVTISLNHKTQHNNQIFFNPSPQTLSSTRDIFHNRISTNLIPQTVSLSQQTQHHKKMIANSLRPIQSSSQRTDYNNHIFSHPIQQPVSSSQKSSQYQVITNFIPQTMGSNQQSEKQQIINKWVPNIVNLKQHNQQHNQIFNNPISQILSSDQYNLHQNRIITNIVPQTIGTNCQTQRHQVANNPMPRIISSTHQTQENQHISINPPIHQIVNQNLQAQQYQVTPNSVVLNSRSSQRSQQNSRIQNNPIPSALNSRYHYQQHEHVLNIPVQQDVSSSVHFQNQRNQVANNFIPQAISLSHEIHHRTIHNPMPQIVNSNTYSQYQQNHLFSNPVPQKISSSQYMQSHSNIIGNQQGVGSNQQYHQHTHQLRTIIPETMSSTNRTQHHNHILNNPIPQTISSIERSQQQRVTSYFNPQTSSTSQQLQYNSQVLSHPFSQTIGSNRNLRSRDHITTFPIPQTVISSHKTHHAINNIIPQIVSQQTQHHKQTFENYLPSIQSSNQQLDYHNHIFSHPIVQSVNSNRHIQYHNQIITNSLPQTVSSSQDIHHKHIITNHIPQTQSLRRQSNQHQVVTNLIPQTMSSNHQIQRYHNILNNPALPTISASYQTQEKQQHYSISPPIHQIINKNLQSRQHQLISNPALHTFSSSQQSQQNGQTLSNQIPQILSSKFHSQQYNQIHNVTVQQTVGSNAQSQQIYNHVINHHIPLTVSLSHQTNHQVVNNPIPQILGSSTRSQHQKNRIFSNLLPQSTNPSFQLQQNKSMISDHILPQNANFDHQARQDSGFSIKNAVQQTISLSNQMQHNQNIAIKPILPTSGTFVQSSQHISTIIPRTLVFGHQTQHQLVTKNLQHVQPQQFISQQQSISHTQTQLPTSLQISQRNPISTNSLISGNNQMQSNQNLLLESQDRTNPHLKALRASKSITSHRLLDVSNPESNNHYMSSQLAASQRVLDDDDQILIDPDYDASYRGLAVAKKLRLADKPTFEVN